MRSFVLSAVACVCAATAAVAQAPVPAGPPVSTLPALGSAAEPLPSGPAAKGCCTVGKCAGAPCVPDVVVAKVPVYSTVTREFCVPTCSCLDLLRKCCGLGDECDGPTGETRSKTLLVVRRVPKCGDGCGVCGTAAVAYPGAPAPTKP